MKKTLIDLIVNEWPDWIEIKNGELPNLPPEYEDKWCSVDVAVSDGKIVGTDAINLISKEWIKCYPIKEPTHWMPLPQYPTGKGKLIQLLYDVMRKPKKY